MSTLDHYFYRGKEEEKEIVDFFGNGHHLNILVSVGSTGNWKNLGLLLDPVFSNSKIVISGNPNNPIRSDNILNKPFVNHTAIMHKVDILICHGGNGTTYQALSYGVPLLLFQAISSKIGTFSVSWKWGSERVWRIPSTPWMFANWLIAGLPRDRMLFFGGSTEYQLLFGDKTPYKPWTISSFST